MSFDQEVLQIIKAARENSLHAIPERTHHYHEDGYDTYPALYDMLKAMAISDELGEKDIAQKIRTEVDRRYPDFHSLLKMLPKKQDPRGELLQMLLKRNPTFDDLLLLLNRGVCSAILLPYMEKTADTFDAWKLIHSRQNSWRRRRAAATKMFQLATSFDNWQHLAKIGVKRELAVRNMVKLAGDNAKQLITALKAAKPRDRIYRYIFWRISKITMNTHDWLSAIQRYKAETDLDYFFLYIAIKSAQSPEDWEDIVRHCPDNSKAKKIALRGLINA